MALMKEAMEEKVRQNIREGGLQRAAESIDAVFALIRGAGYDIALGVQGVKLVLLVRHSIDTDPNGTGGGLGLLLASPEDTLRLIGAIGANIDDMDTPNTGDCAA